MNKKYLKEISFQIIISLSLESDNTGILFNLSVCFSLCGMRSTIFALETHNDQVSEIGDTYLACFHLAYYLAWRTWNFKNYSLLFHEIILLKRFGEIYLSTYSLCFNLFYLLFSILFVVTHRDKLLQRSFSVRNLQIFIGFGSKRVFYGWITTYVCYLHCQGESLALQILVDCCQEFL